MLLQIHCGWCRCYIIQDASNMRNKINKWTYYRLLWRERFVGFKRMSPDKKSQYAEQIGGKWTSDIIMHDDGVKIKNPE